jgi:hypothetical protein
MLYMDKIRIVLSFTALLASTACATGVSGTPALPVSTTSTMLLHASRTHDLAASAPGVVLAVTQSGNIIDVFSSGSVSSTVPIAQITTGLVKATAIATDKKGNLFVADEGASAIKEYTNGAKAPSAVIHDVVDPQGIAIDDKGNLWVSQLPSEHAYFGVVDEYPYNATAKTFSSKPKVTIDGKGLTALIAPHGVAFDSTGDLFIADPTQPANIFEVKAGSTTVTLVPLPQIALDTITRPVQAPYGITIAGSGSKETFYVTDFLGSAIVAFSRRGTLTWNVWDGGGSQATYWAYIASASDGEVFSAASDSGGLFRFSTSGVQTAIAAGTFVGVATARQW